MKLLISVINSDDTYSLTDALTEQGYITTIVSSIGGFLREGNTTLLIGVQDGQVVDVLKIIQITCHTRRKYLHPYPAIANYEEAYLATPIEVEVGGAVVFVVDVERFEKF
jgi:uncharacterized protein YaaQ